MLKRWPKQLLILVVVIVIITGLLFYLRRPSRLTGLALNKAAAATSHHFVTKVVLANSQQTQSILGEEAQIEITLDGAYRRAENQAAAIQSNINMSIATDSVTVGLTGEARLIDDKTYIFITKSPPLFPILQKLKGQWIELPRGQQSLTTPAPSQAELLTDVTYLTQEEISDESTHKYQAQASQAAIVSFMDNLARLLGTNLTDDQINQLRSSTTEVTQVPVEIWLTPLTSDLRQLKSSLTIPGANTVETIITLTDRDQPVEILPPENFVSLEQAVENLPN